ncbi:MAG TPA: hypothetical protein PLV06_06535 [Bacteroidales bacterium]|nr:hypothetical protein [Bacteroidales bacterium]HPJ58975.1 hypothetical protein [Bacteroidales bacterium]HPR12023.1 hypothetical protein [Bacteroidales bacterium]HRW86280.1 hypothetical protein [Bacteroidales bacterium]
MTEEVELEKYKKAWKTEQSFNEERLSRTRIQEFMRSESGSLRGLFKKNIIIDIVLKIALAASFCVLLVLYLNQGRILLLNSSMIILSISSVIIQIWIYGRIPDGRGSDLSIRAILESYIRFHHRKYFHSLLVNSLTASLVFISGALYWLYFKYGAIRSFQLEDYLVFSSFIVVAFVLSAFIQIKSSNFHIHQLERCLVYIEQDSLNGGKLIHYKKLKNRLIVFFSIFLVIGLMLLILLLFR